MTHTKMQCKIEFTQQPLSQIYDVTLKPVSIVWDVRNSKICQFFYYDSLTYVSHMVNSIK